MGSLGGMIMRPIETLAGNTQNDPTSPDGIGRAAVVDGQALDGAGGYEGVDDGPDARNAPL